MPGFGLSSPVLASAPDSAGVLETNWRRRQAEVAARDLSCARARTRTRSACREKDGADAYVDYTAAVRGHLQLAPEGTRLAALADDYARMLDDGLIFEAPPTFASLLEHCQGIQQRANADAVVSEAISKRE